MNYLFEELKGFMEQLKCDFEELKWLMEELKGQMEGMNSLMEQLKYEMEVQNDLSFSQKDLSAADVSPSFFTAALSTGRKRLSVHAFPSTGARGR